MTNNELKFIEYLDKAVEWEKEKQKELISLTKPFKKSEISDNLLMFLIYVE